MLSFYAVSKAALFRLTENLAAETRGHAVTVFTSIPGLVRTAMSEAALSCGEPSIEQWFKRAFANQEGVSAESVGRSVVYIASGAADALLGRYILATDDVAQMVAGTSKIQEQDLYVCVAGQRRLTEILRLMQLLASGSGARRAIPKGRCTLRP